MMEARTLELGRDALLRRLSPIGSARPRWDPRVIGRSEGQRLIVEYALKDDALLRARPRARVIAKFFSDGMGAHSYQVMRRVAAGLDRLPGGPAVLAIPEAHFYDPELRLLVQQRVEGTLYPELVSRRNYRMYLRLAGRALACLHRIDAGGEPVRRIGEHIAELMRPHPLRVAEEVPALRSRIEALVAALHAAEAGWPALAPAWLHRDFHMSQLFHHRGRVWLIDWDLAAAGDPALDVGNFLIQVRKEIADRTRSEPGRAAFLEGYAEGGGADVGARPAVYEAFNCLRRACKRYRVRDGRWQERMNGLVAAAERCLAG